MANESCLANSVEIGPRTAFGIETLLDEQANNSELAENLDVDIIECTNAIDNTGLAEVEDPYATEYSSSFDDTILQSEVDDAEVESRFCGKNDWQSAFDGFSSLLQMRKKKLTSHWRRFIRPLMWRCKWTELRIKELESQALHYGRELAAHYIRKKNQLELGQFDLKNLGSRSVPFSSQSSRKRAVKRRKRKKVECMADLNSYLSFHNLFSYFETKISDPDGAGIPRIDELSYPEATADKKADGNKEFVINDDWSFDHFRDSDNSLEQIIMKIDEVISQVNELRTQFQMGMSESMENFSSSENLNILVLCDAQTSSGCSPTFSGADTSIYDFGEFPIPENGVSRYGEDMTITVPAIIESTMGLFPDANVSLYQSPNGDSCEDSAEAEMHTLGNVSDSTYTIEKSNQENGIALLEQSTLASYLTSEFHFPKRKRKRGERKACSSNWSQKNIVG